MSHVAFIEKYFLFISHRLLAMPPPKEAVIFPSPLSCDTRVKILTKWWEEYRSCFLLAIQEELTQHPLPSMINSQAGSCPDPRSPPIYAVGTFKASCRLRLWSDGAGSVLRSPFPVLIQEGPTLLLVWNHVSVMGHTWIVPCLWPACLFVLGLVGSVIVPSR